MIKIEQLKKYFGTTKAVDDISFSVNKGEIFGFLGPNGAGKTTTIRCLMDFLRPTSGRMSIAGMDAQADSTRLKEKIGYVSPDVQLYPHWTGEQHFQFIESVRGESKTFPS